jgi:hypothetical protein
MSKRDCTKEEQEFLDYMATRIGREFVENNAEFILGQYRELLGLEEAADLPIVVDKNDVAALSDALSNFVWCDGRKGVDNGGEARK